MLAYSITALNSRKEVISVTVCGDAAELLTQADLSNDIDGQKLNPFPYVENSAILGFRTPVLVCALKPVCKSCVDNWLQSFHVLARKLVHISQCLIQIDAV